MNEKTKATLEREARRVRVLMREAYDARDSAEDFLYGALVALEWASGEDTMRPSKAFGWVREVG